MVLPILLLLIGSTGDLFQIIIEKGVSSSVHSTNFLGKWTAYEYYDNNIHPKGQNSDLDYSKINQIAKLISYESQEYPCPTKKSRIEQRLEFFKVNFLADGKAEIFEKQYYKMNSFDSKCQNEVYDESYDQKISANWNIDIENASLVFTDSILENPTEFKIIYFDQNELHLSLKKDNDFICVKLHKD